jgi:hypothetical protein
MRLGNGWLRRCGRENETEQGRTDMVDNSKMQLISLLEKRVFQPVLSATTDDFESPQDREILEDVQDNLRAERQRFREEYESAEELREAFHDDVTSEEGQELDRESHLLGLPSLVDVEMEFDELCEELGVGG